MKRSRIWMIAAILTICGATMLTSCSSNDDNPMPGSGGQNAEELTVTVGGMDMKLKLVEGGTYSMKVFMAEKSLACNKHLRPRSASALCWLLKMMGKSST